MTRKDDIIYVLRTCNADMTSRDGFKYPKRGMVEAPDWRDDDQCGGGLHGLPWGVGDAGLLYMTDDAVSQVLRVRTSEGYQHGTGDMTGKCKFRRGTVVYTGTRDGAIAYLDAHGAKDKPVVFAARIAGDGGTATAGYRGTATAGNWGTATAGDRGTATAGYGGTATAGYGGTATAGYGGTATAGDRGTATAGNWGTATAGDWGTIIIKYYDGTRYRISVGYVGENGIKPNTPYQLNDNREFEEASE